MKKIVILLFVFAFLLSVSACKSSESNTSSTESNQASDETLSSAIPEISKEAAFTDRYIDSNDDLIYENTYAADGTMLVGKAYSQDGVLVEESVFAANGRKLIYKEYDDEGNVTTIGTFEYYGETVRATYKNDKEEVFLITETLYKDGKIQSEKSYDGKGALDSNIVYEYNDVNKLISSSETFYLNGVVAIFAENTYDPESSNIIKSLEHNYDENGELVYTDEYGITDGNYEFIARYNANGVKIPVEDLPEIQ